MIVGEQQRFMAAIITFKVEVDPNTGQPSNKLTAEAINELRSKCGVDIRTSDKAVEDPKVHEYISQCVEETNKKSISRAAHIRKFKLVPNDFSIPGGELTPTLKLKRKVAEKKYETVINEMF